MLHVSFVCTYNRARSVMAAAMFTHQLQQRGAVVRVSSAGTRTRTGYLSGLDWRAGLWVEQAALAAKKTTSQF